ncbi:MAG: hypothetical protein ACTSYL_06430 [Candidatus Thorarchaeota archaeon]
MSTLAELEYEQVSPRLLEILRRQGYTNLTEFQKSALDSGLFRGKSQLLVTYDYDEAYDIAEFALLNTLAMDIRARGIILCPNPHLVEKRLRAVKPICHKLGIETTLIARRKTATRADWKGGRLIIASFRSFTIALRSHPEILDGVQSVLIERLDLIGDPWIGSRLESALVTMKIHSPNPQFIAILPQVADLDDLSRWLNADIVEDRVFGVRRIFSVKAFESINESIIDLTEFAQYKQGQIMILCSNIDTCERIALQLAGFNKESGPSLDLRIMPEKQDDLRSIAHIISQTFPGCDLTEELTSTIRRGIGFLHEGVPRSQRREISLAWEEERIPVLIMPIRFAIASGLRASLVFVIGVFMQNLGSDLSDDEELTMLTEWQLSEVLYSAGRNGADTEGFGIVVVDNESERQRVLGKFFVTGDEGIVPRLGEVDSSMDDPENAQDLILSQMCQGTEPADTPFAILGHTYWAESNRVTNIQQQTEAGGEIRAETLITLRSTNSTIKRAKAIPDSSVKLVSVTPTKIEGLVHSGTRELWHYVALKATEGVSCSCESWKYQGISKHRLCKHLVKFATFALREEETKPYAASVIQQALRGLGLLDELEQAGLVRREHGTTRCTELGKDVVMLGVPVVDAKRVLNAIRKQRSGLKKILSDIAAARTGIPQEIIDHVMGHLPARKIADLVCKDDLPGLVENIIEEVQYINTILLRLMSKEARQGLNREALSLHKSLLELLDSHNM